MNNLDQASEKKMQIVNLIIKMKTKIEETKMKHHINIDLTKLFMNVKSPWHDRNPIKLKDAHKKDSHEDKSEVEEN